MGDGGSAQARFCHKCGAPVITRGAFCHACGAELVRRETSTMALSANPSLTGGAAAADTAVARPIAGPGHATATPVARGGGMPEVAVAPPMYQPHPYALRSQPGLAIESQSRAGTGSVWGAIVCALLAVAVLPPLFGGIAIYLATRVQKSSKDLGTTLLIMAIICTVIGMIIGAIVGVRTFGG